MWSSEDQMEWGGSMNRKRPFNNVGYNDETEYVDAYGPSPASFPRNSFNDSNFGYNNNWNNYGDNGGQMSAMGSGMSFSGGQDDSSFAEDVPLDGKRGYQSQAFQFQGGFGGQGKRGGRGGRGRRGGGGGGFDGKQGGFGGRGGGGRGRGGGSVNRGGNRGQQGNQNRGGGGVRGNRGGNFGNQGGRGGNRGGWGGNFGNMQKKPGLPPQKVFGGTGQGGAGQGGMKGKRGKGNQIGGQMAPVHSLSKVATQPVDTASMSTAEKIHRFALFVQGEPLKVNAIQTIENAITGSKLNLKTQYEVEELMRVSGKWMFTGRLILSGIFLARAVGANKKEVKHETYQKALDVLKSKTVAEIFNLQDPGADAIRNELSSTLDTNKDVNKQAATILEKKVAKFAAINTNQEGFMCLVDYLRESENLPESKVSAIEQALAASHCGLSHSYDFKASRLPSGRFFFHGILKVGDVVIAIGKGYKKKDAKIDTYAVAFNNLTTKTVQELLVGIELETEIQVDEDKNISFHMEPDAKKLSLPEKIDRMIQTLKDSVYKENNINTMDVLATSLGLTKTCVYRKVESITPGEKSNIVCDLYLENILIASGEGEKRKDAQVDAYNVAWDTLCTTSGERVIKDHKRLKPEDSNDPTVIDVYVKGSGKPNGDSNLAGLKRNNFDSTDSTKTVDLLVILEHEDWTIDRKRQAFCILNYSATMNGILLEWQIEPEGNMFKCTVQLQGQVVGEAYAMSKHNSRNLAAADALFKLYETQDVIKVTRRDDSQLWIPYDDIKRKADSLKDESGETEDPVEQGAPVVSDGATKPDSGKPPPRQPNKWVLHVAKGIVEEYKDQFTLEELIFGPGMPLCESKEVRSMARSFDIKHDVRQLDGQSYLVTHHKMSPQNMAKCLKQSGGTSGKYILVDRSVLPSHADILPDLDKQMQLGGNLVGMKSNFQNKNVASSQKQGYQPKFLQMNSEPDMS